MITHNILLSLKYTIDLASMVGAVSVGKSDDSYSDSAYGTGSISGTYAEGVQYRQVRHTAATIMSNCLLFSIPT